MEQRLRIPTLVVTFRRVGVRLVMRPLQGSGRLVLRAILRASPHDALAFITTCAQLRAHTCLRTPARVATDAPAYACDRNTLVREAQPRAHVRLRVHARALQFVGRQVGLWIRTYQRFVVCGRL